MIHNAFPSASLEKQIFTFYPNIYSSVPLSEDLMAHENTHLAQQKSFLGALKWWRRYIDDPKFRTEQEIEACKAQLRAAKSMVKDRNKISGFIDILAKNLSSEVYGNCVSFEEARKRIND